MLLESIPLKKLIAGVDVTFSNSIIEDYNNRPHLALWGLTPNQECRYRAQEHQSPIVSASCAI